MKRIVIFTTLLAVVAVTAIESRHAHVMREEMRAFMEVGDRNTRAQGEARDREIAQLEARVKSLERVLALHIKGGAE